METGIDRLCNEIKAVQEVFQNVQEFAKGPQAAKLLGSRSPIEKNPVPTQRGIWTTGGLIESWKEKKAIQHFGLRALK